MPKRILFDTDPGIDDSCVILLALASPELSLEGLSIDHGNCSVDQATNNALSILDHVLDCGFVDEVTGFIRGYRETTTGKFCLNYKHNSDWLCPGSMAKVAFQLLSFAGDLGQDPRAPRLRNIAARCGEWLRKNVEPVPNGWFPRRTTPDGRLHRKSPDGGEDPFWQSSADGLFILQLQAALTERKLADYREPLRLKAEGCMAAGGIFGRINHDTYDVVQWYLFSVIFLLCAGYTLRKNEHVRIDIGTGRFSARTRAWIDIFGLVFFLFPTCYVFIDLGWPFVQTSFHQGEMSANPGGLIRWRVKLMVPVGFTLLALQSLSELIKRVAFLQGLIPDPLEKKQEKTAEQLLAEEIAPQARGAK